MPLYHKEIGFPKKMKFKKVENLHPSAHALREANLDRYGRIEIPNEFDPTTWDVIEIEVENGALNKVVARKSLDETRDVVIVFLPLTRLIKTVWVNEKNDLHKTLDKSAYSKP
jgi:hypothetical protein